MGRDEAFPASCSLSTGCYLLFALVQVSLALPALAQEEAPSPADSPTGYVFRWLNLALVLGAFIWVIRKFGGPFFRGRGQGDSECHSRSGRRARAAAERELNEATRQLASLDAEIQEMRRAASRESASEAERLRALAKQRSGEDCQGGRWRRSKRPNAPRSSSCARMAARAATDRAAALVRQRMNEQAERALFGSFLGELERGAQ